MAMEVLRDKSQISQARQELINKGASLVDSPLRSLMRKLGLIPGIAIGDMLKSWDVLATVNFLQKHVAKNEPVLDIGCYASEIIVALHKLGYVNLSGADLNPNLRQMPYPDTIHYEIVDFLQTKFQDASFRAITSISVIEHGFNGLLLLKEISRLLKPGGYFIASFDYYPEKINTEGTKYFDMEWKIFSQEEIAGFVAEAAGYGLSPCGRMHYSVKDRPIDYGGKQYTFGWLALIKST
jgi:SAM-dependent methyltransferase